MVLAAAAILLFFLSLSIVVPAPTRFLLPLGVGAPEVSPLLLVASAIVCGVAMRGMRLSSLALLTCALAAIAVALSAWPLLRVPATLRTFDAAMTAAGIAPPSRPFDPSNSRTPAPSNPHPVSILRGVPFAAGLALDVYRAGGADRAGGAGGAGGASGVGAPVVVQLYGGGWQRGAPGDNDAFARHLASRGYLTIAPDYRHAPQSTWPAQIEDVRAALAWVRTHASEYGGDAQRVALVGRSAGAQLALVAGYERADPAVRAVINFYGPSDLVEGWRSPPHPDPTDARSLLETYLGGTPDGAAERYRVASPVSYVSRDAPPTLHLYGSRDHVVEARFGRDLHRRLQAEGVQSVLLEVPWAEHAFDAVPNGLSARVTLPYVMRFLEWAMARSR